MEQADPPPPNGCPRAVASGRLDVFNPPVECHVLSDERRVLDTSQVQALLGAAKERHFRRMIARIPGVSDSLALRPSIVFTRLDGGVAYGYEAGHIIDICAAYHRAFAAGVLHHKQHAIAIKAISIAVASAKVGLEAMIDEAAGYTARPNFRGEQFAVYLRDEPAAWRERWRGDVMMELSRFYGVRWMPGMPPPRCLWRAEGMIYDLVIGEEIMAEVRRRNPNPQHGSNHHQLFREAVQRVLDNDLQVILALARTASSKTEFWHHMRVHYRRVPLQLRLN